MEKQASPAAAAAAHHLSPHDWESLVDDFLSGSPSRRSKWLHLPVLDLALSSLLRRDFPVHLKPLLLLLLEESSPILLPSPSSHLPILLDHLRSFLQSPASSSPPPDASPASSSHSLRDQFLTSATSIFIVSLPNPLDPPSISLLDPLVELLLAVANRPNHGADRQTRAAACECLRELELAYPLLLSDVAGHIWSLAQAERTHASQSYALLLAAAAVNVVRSGLLSSGSSILSTATPFVPFNAPRCLLSPSGAGEPSEVNLREIRRVVGFLLERSRQLNPPAQAVLASSLAAISGALEPHVPSIVGLIKVQFSGLMHTNDPFLVHAVLSLSAQLPNAYSGEDKRALDRRLALASKEAQLQLVFRLLALHWLLGLPRATAKDSLAPLASTFYPSIFDPLTLKAKKLDVLAYISSGVGVAGGLTEQKEDGQGVAVVRLLEDGLVCVSAFKWLPLWSSETTVAFRTIHKFLITCFPHESESNAELVGDRKLESSIILLTIKTKLVELAMEHRSLVPVIVAFVDRLLKCKKHNQAGELILQTFDENLLPKLETGYRLSSYFLIFQRIAENESIPPRGLLELLTRNMVTLTEKHGPDTGLRTWLQGSKVLGICRTMLVRLHSSRVFHPLSRLLTFACQYFPDLEVRDNARIYLRMLLCVPGKKMREVLSLGEQIPVVSASPNVASSFFQVPSPRWSQDRKAVTGVASCIHLERVIPLLVKQSWSLALPSLMGNDNDGSLEGFRDAVDPSSLGTESESEASGPMSSEQIGFDPEPFSVVDSKVAEILRVLRKYYACIPDYRHMPGIKISMPCVLRFESEPFVRLLGADLSAIGPDDMDGIPALYAATITFSSTSKYGNIPACRVPFLLGEPPNSGDVLIPSGFVGDSCFRAAINIELEPREPMPGLLDASIKANVENGQVISSSLQSILVGIEDMFLRAGVPPDVAADDTPSYLLDLFHALWEACGSSSNTGREIFPLKGGKGAVAIYGTRSVKLLEESSDSLIKAVERHLAPFVVCVIGEGLVSAVRRNGFIKDVIWIDSSTGHTSHVDSLVPYSEVTTPLQLQYVEEEGNVLDLSVTSRRNVGKFLILIFLPPRFHLLFQMEIGNASTLVRIRTDHWRCLAYVDDFLESLLT